MSEKIKESVTHGIEEGIRRSGKYEVPVRDKSFAKALRKMELQQNGTVTDDQLTQFGLTLGVDHVCYVSVEKSIYSTGVYFIDYRMIHVSSGKAKKGSESVHDESLSAATDNIAKRLLKEDSGNIAKNQLKNDNTVYSLNSVQVNAQFPGGMMKFRNYIISHLQDRNFNIPTDELRMQFRFIIEKDGRLTDIQVVDDGRCPEAAAIAIQALSSCPKWIPAKIDGRPVRMLFAFPIIIKYFNENKPIVPKPTTTDPQYPGGTQKFRDYIISKLEDHDFNIKSNRINMQFRFVVEEDGLLGDIKIVDDGGHPDVAEKVVEVLRSSPKWKPATIDGNPVRMLYTIPIMIRPIDENKPTNPK